MTFIHPFYSIVESYWPMYIWWKHIQLDYVTNLYQHHLLSMFITRGTQLFFVGRDVRGGSPKWPRALVFRGGYPPRKTSCKSTVGANRLAGPIISWADHYLSFNNSPISIWPKNENVRSGVLHLPQAQCKRTLLLGLIHASLQPWQ